MVYSTLAQIKRRLAIPTANVAFDAEITDAQTTATRAVDLELANIGLAVPLTNTTDTARLGEIEADLSGAIIQENKGESGPAVRLRTRFRAGMDEFLANKMGGLTPTSIGGIADSGLEKRD